MNDRVKLPAVLVETLDALAVERDQDELVWGSMIKEAIK